MTPALRYALGLLSFLPTLCREARAAQTRPDSVVYHVDASSRLVVKTGKAGLFGFAGHTHLIRARGVSGELVFTQGARGSFFRLKIPTDSLEVLTPPDTAEIRKVTRAMRTEVLHVDHYPEMVFAADSLNARSGTMAFPLALTMEGVTRRVPVSANVRIGSDTIRATGTFVARQTDFGIEPFSGGPGGTVKVADKVTFCFDMVAVKDPAGVTHRPSQLSGDEATTVAGCVENASPNEEPAHRPM
jgi:polyisoprenoid-binding protein YceI